MASSSNPLPQGALDGLLVTELGARVGTSVCGALLAQLGATVVYVEPPAGLQGTHKGAWREQFAAGKLSLCAGPQDDALLRDLLARSDAVLLASDLRAFAPPDGLAQRCVVCDVTAFGHTTALAGQAHEDVLVQALAGLVDTTGDPAAAPTPIAVPLTEIMTGVYAAAASVAALRVRRLGGQGQQIDMALFDCAFAAISTFIPGLMAGQGKVISRLGNRHPSASPTNAYRASDGWVLLSLGSEGHWQRLCHLIGRADFITDPGLATQVQRIARTEEVDAAIEAWTRQHTVADCIATLNGLSLPSGPISFIDGWPRDGNLQLRDMVQRLHDPVGDREVAVPGSPLRMSGSPARQPRRIPAVDADRAAVQELASRSQASSAAAMPDAPKLPLAGVRVIEIGHYTSVPMCARFLAQLGADVIKVETPEGEGTRTWPPLQNGRAIFFRFNNGDKRSLALDLASPQGQDTLRRLLLDADVLVENLKPGALARLGFPLERLRALNPRLVYCAVSGFGAHSLYADRPAFDPIIQAMSGFMHAVAPEGMPMKSGVSSADILGSEMSLLGILAALEFRDRSGQGQFVDISMQDVAAWGTQTAWNGGIARRVVPTSTLRVSDGYVLALSPEATARAALGGGAPTRAEAVELLRRAGIAGAPVLDVKEAVFLPHTRDRQLWFTLEEDGERWPVMANPLRLGGTPARLQRLAPLLNADGPAILAALATSATPQLEGSA